jgi:phage terminase large subunit GpA-like protein
MPEFEHPITWVEVVYICDVCREGEMEHTGETRGVWYDQPRYHHRCPNCGDVSWLSLPYKSVRRFKRIETEDK